MSHQDNYAGPAGTYEKADKGKRRLSDRLRLTVLLVVLAVSTVVGLLHQRFEGFSTVSVDALCPFGGLESIYFIVTAGTYLKRVAVGSLILLIATIAVGLIFRRAFCGDICPLGTLQELFGRLTMRRSLRMPAVIDVPARYLKYVVLFAIVGFSTYMSELVIRPYDPWVAYQHLTSADLFDEFAVGFGILVVSLLGSFFYDRFFCKYLCPMGAFLALFSKIGLFGVKRDAGKCIDCGACDKACPVNIEVATADSVRSAECLNCNQCVNSCPVQGALTVSGPGKRTLSATMALGLVAIIFAGVLGITSATGTLKWTEQSIGEEMKESGGTFDPMSIKGKTTFEEIEKDLKIPRVELKKAFGLLDADFDKPLREFADRGFETDEVRDFVAKYLSARGVKVEESAAPVGEGQGEATQ